MTRARVSREVFDRLYRNQQPMGVYRIYDLDENLVASADTSSAQQAVWQAMFAADLSVTPRDDMTHIVKIKPTKGAEVVVGYVVPSTKAIAPRVRLVGPVG